MLRALSPTALTFGDPVYLWLLTIPMLLFLACVRGAFVRWRDARQFRHSRQPVQQRIGFAGVWPFWLCLAAALACTTLAMARPQAVLARTLTAGIDLIVLQDGSASMHVRDVRPDRWQRSTRFLRVIAESLRWQDDRIALALFARIAAPQIRLTRDPNTFFFFLDHLDRESPFPLVDDTTWDTNIELGIYWGMRLIAKDEEFNGPSMNGPAFVLVSDGQAWSGDMERALRLARDRDIPVFVVGVGTAAGGYIPEATAATPGLSPSTQPRLSALSALHSSLDRTSLLTIATAGGGRYFDLDRQSDRQIASTVIDAARRKAGMRGVEQKTEELYWLCLVAAACLISAGTLFLQERGALLVHVLGTAASLLVLWTLTQ